MDQSIVRIQNIQLTNFKNVRQGTISFPFFLRKDYFETSAELLGIYGQNGSGKTAVVDALRFIKRLLMGLPLPGDAVELIYHDQDHAVITITFSIQIGIDKCLVDYEATLARLNKSAAYVAAESIKYRKSVKDKFLRLTSLVEYNSLAETELIRPAIKRTELIKNTEKGWIELNVARELTITSRTSFIFSEKIVNLMGTQLTSPLEKHILESLRLFASRNLFVVENRTAAISMLDIFLPINFSLVSAGYRIDGNLTVGLSEPTEFSRPVFVDLIALIRQMNIVLSKIIPSFSIEAKEMGNLILENGQEGVRFELLAVRYDVQIPLRYESDGIKKIISVISTLIAVYNRPDITVVIDELDAGVFEYLLGEILQILEKFGKGQLLFTSHNLRPLEMIDKSSIVFTTTNPDNRYIRMQYIKTNHNLRDQYLREIMIGGQKETIYDETNRYEINSAFRKAGEVDLA